MAKRYRFQVQFDLYAKDDKKAHLKVVKKLSKLKGVNNEVILWAAESPFGSIHNREIQLEQLQEIPF